MNLLLLKLTLAPSLVALASLAGRRWGPRVAGMVAGFPIVAGPVLFFYGLEQGRAFAAHAAASTLLGLFSLSLFCLAYAWTAGRTKWPLSLAAGWAAFALGTLALSKLDLAWPAALGVAVASLAAAAALMPGTKDSKAALRPPAWDLPLRMASTAALVLGLTWAAGHVGPGISGLLTPFPVASTVLVAFAHHQGGLAAAEKVLKGLLLSLNAFACFCAVISATIETLGTGPAFGLGLVSAGLVQAGLTFVTRR